MTVPTPEQIRKAEVAAAARSEPFKLKRQRDIEVAEATQALRNQITAIASEIEESYREKIRAAHDAKISAEGRLAELKHARASAFGYPLKGITLVEWKTTGLRQDRLLMGDRRAVVEIWGPDSESPENMEYDQPLEGSLVLRYLKKNGEPSKRFETGVGPFYDSGYFMQRSYFLPEGFRLANVVEADAWMKKLKGGIAAWRDAVRGEEES